MSRPYPKVYAEAYAQRHPLGLAESFGLAMPPAAPPAQSRRPLGQ